MKVKELKQILSNCDDELEILICDDGMSPDYFSIDFGAKSKFSRLIRKASTKKEKLGIYHQDQVEIAAIFLLHIAPNVKIIWKVARLVLSLDIYH